MAENKSQMTSVELQKDTTSRRYLSFLGDSYISVWEKGPPSSVSMIWQRIKQNPFIPLGLGGTVYYLTRGISNMQNRALSQKMMRGRVLAQSFTVAAMIIGVSVQDYKNGGKPHEK